MAHSATARPTCRPLDRVCRARASALGLACVVLAGCSLSPPRTAARPETIALVARESPIVAVHYQDIIPAPPPAEGAPSEARWASVAAPTRRIKERFLEGMRVRLPSAEVRNVSEPRFAYLVRYLMPDPHWLKRTFGRGLAFDFYSPRQSLHLGGGGVLRVPMTIHARLLRLDDLSVLWADSCSFEPGPLDPVATALADAERTYTMAGLDRADRCADTLLAAFLGPGR
jgi:hypothetical protein